MANKFDTALKTADRASFNLHGETATYKVKATSAESSITVIPEAITDGIADTVDGQAAVKQRYISVSVADDTVGKIADPKPGDTITIDDVTWEIAADYEAITKDGSRAKCLCKIDQKISAHKENHKRNIGS